MKKPFPLPCFAYTRCAAPAGATGKRWWRYELRTRSGLNKVTGVRSGTESEVRDWLIATQRKMEVRERPFGATWRDKILRSDVAGELPIA